MIDKLRKRIFWIIQITLSIIILGLIILFGVMNYRNTIISSTRFMDRIEIRGETINDKPRELDEPRINNEDFMVNLEGVYRLQIKDNKIIKESDGVTNEIKNNALKIENSTAEEGYIGNYIYKIKRFGNNEKEIILMENENAINELKLTIISSIVIGVFALIIVYLIAKRISETIVKPVKESFEKQKQFVSDASHELKTPLAVIEANADVLQEKQGESKWITYIQNEVQSMNKLVNDLLVLSKLLN